MVRRTLTFFTNIVTLFMLFILFCTPLLAQGRGDPCNPGCIWSTFNPDPNVWGEDGGLHCLKKNTAVPCDDDSAAPAAPAPDNSGNLQPLAQPSDSSASSDGSGFSLPSISLPSFSGSSGLSGLMPDLSFSGLLSLKSFIVLMIIVGIVSLPYATRFGLVCFALAIVAFVLGYIS